MPISGVVRLALTVGTVVLGVLVWTAMVLVAESLWSFDRLDESYGFGHQATYVTGIVLSVAVAVPLFYSMDEVDSSLLAKASVLAVVFGAVLIGRAIDNTRPFIDLRRASGPDLVEVGEGRVAVTGTVQDDEMVTAPFSGTGAVGWSVRVLEQGGFREGLEVLFHEQGGQPFTIEDVTGRVRVDPTDAELRLGTDMRAEVFPDDDVPPSVREFLAERSVGSFDRKRIFYESRLEPGETVTVIGTVTATDGGTFLVGGDGSPVIEDDDFASTLTTYRRYVLYGGPLGAVLSVLGIAGLLVTL